DAPLPRAQTLALGAAAVPLAWLLHRFVERPVIGWRLLREQRQRLTGLVAVGASLAVVVGSGGVSLAGAQQPLTSQREAPGSVHELDPVGTEFVPANLAPGLDTEIGRAHV